MFAICIESSHSKGMGHLFRMLSFAKYLQEQNEKFIFILNHDRKSLEILKKNNIEFKTINLNDIKSNWEENIIKQYNILYWINDRLDTKEEHAINIKKNNVTLITFDDLGTGAEFSDINICGLFFNKKNLKGKKVLKGIEYLILNEEIDTYKKPRNKIENIIVTLGGSDTYGVTIKVLQLLKKHHIKATIHIGPSFSHLKELNNILTSDYQVISTVPSLIEEFSKYDLAITGGGITPFEANGSGLPCLIIANETFEIPNGEFLEQLGSSKFLGYYNKLEESLFSELNKLNINNMSLKGLNSINTTGADKIYKEIKQL